MKTPFKKNYIKFIKVRQCLKHIGFKQRKIDALKHRIYELDKESMSLVYNDKLYWENRKLVWELTDQLIILKGVH